MPQPIILLTYISARCPDPVLDHGTFVRDLDQKNAVVHFTCDSEFDLIGDPSATCHPSGRWAMPSLNVPVSIYGR